MSPAEEVVLPKKWLYLFYRHVLRSECYFSLSKIEIDLTTRQTSAPALNLPPILKLVSEEFRFLNGMRCVALGSKLYFLGGTVILDDLHQTHRTPRDVYVFDMLTNDFKKMDARLNAGKPSPCAVFAANGKLYALGRIPDWYPGPGELPSNMMLFERFDPSTNEWQVIDSLPMSDKGRSIVWVDCTVWEKRQQVALLGRECGGRYAMFVYHLKQDKWTRHKVGEWSILEAQLPEEGGRGDYLYGLHYIGQPPLKLDPDCIQDLALLHGTQLGSRVKGLARMSVTGDKQGLSFFGLRYVSRCNRCLRYLGNDYFGYITCGMPESPDGPDYDGELNTDTSTRGVTITLFKEKEKEKEEEEEENQRRKKKKEKLYFQAEILHSQQYVYKIPEYDYTNYPFYNIAHLVDCIVVTPENLPKKRKGKKKNKKKNKKNKENLPKKRKGKKKNNKKNKKIKV